MLDYGLWAVTKILWATHHPTQPPYYPITFRGSELEYMVQIKAPSIPDCQEVALSPGGQRKEEHWVVHHSQGEQYQSGLRVIISNSNSGLVPINS